MADVAKTIGGAALVAGGVLLEGASFGAATPLATMIASMGVSLAISGIEGLLAGTPPGHGITTNNPIEPYRVAYGNVLVPGTNVYLEDNGGILTSSNPNNKCFNQVVMLACHPIKSVDQVRFNGRAIPLGAGGSGAQNTTWTYTPSSNQNQTNVTSISRSGGVVTLKLAAAITGINGQQLNIQYVADHTFNGIFTVAQPNLSDNTTFTYLCGGPDTTSSGGYVLTTLPDWKNRIHCDLTSCLGDHTSTFSELLSTSNIWSTACKNLGKASVYLAYYWDSTVFANGLPASSFVIEGYNKIYDPRLGDVTNPAAYAYTTNSALIAADYLTNKVWGYGKSYGTDVPLPQLIAAANICDEDVTLAAGGTEKRYTTNYTFTLDKSRGQILQDLLNEMSGRISWINGQFVLCPGAWVGPSLSLTAANLIGPVDYKVNLTGSDACNGVKGTYSSPASNWNATDLPEYAEDTLHGFATDQWLIADGGERVWKDVSLPACTSASMGQRLLKIDLERIRREGRGTLHCDMSAYPAVALDVIDFTYPHYGWTNKTFEVLSSKLVVQADANGGAPVLGVDLDIAEADSSIYDWSLVEELTPYDSVSPSTDHGQALAGPQFLELESGPATTVVGADGVAIPRILAAWLAAPDATIQSGGTIQVEYQKVGDTLWTPCGSVSGAQTQFYISGVVSGSQYNVQLQGYNAKGVSSGWVQAGPVTVSATATSFSASSLTYPDGQLVSDLQPAQAGADSTSLQAISHTGGQLVPNGNFVHGDIQYWAPTFGATGPYWDPALGLSLSPNSSTQSGTFPVIPGQKYRISFTGATNSAGTDNVYLRIFYSSTYSVNTQTSLSTALTDLLASGSLTSTLTTYDYDWVCPAGMYFASVAMYQLGTVFLYFTNVSVQTYGAADQWGADVTLTNTAAGIVDQGALATINQVNTPNIVANAVNSQIAAQSTSQVICPSGSTTQVSSVTLGTNGGYCKVTCTLNVYGNGGASGATVFLYKGAIGGTQLAQALDVTAAAAATGSSSVTVQAVDTSPGLAQQYTVAVVPNTGVGVICIYSYLIAENAKVKPWLHS